MRVDWHLLFAVVVGVFGAATGMWVFWWIGLVLAVALMTVDLVKGEWATIVALTAALYDRDHG